MLIKYRGVMSYVSEKHISEEVTSTFSAMTFSDCVEVSETTITITHPRVCIRNVQATHKLSVVDQFDFLMIALKKVTNFSFWL